MDPTREIYWNISSGALIYVLAMAAAVALVYAVYRRVRLWRLGVAAERLDRLPERIKGLLIEVFAHRRHLRDRIPGHAHALIFYGFIAQMIATGLISLQEWSGVHFLQGTFYLWYSLLSDCFGLLAILGLCIALWWRLVIRPARLHSVMDDWIALALLLLVFLQGFFVEGLRMAATELSQQPALAAWSPGGRLVAVALGDLEAGTLASLHRFSWWFHAVTAFGFLGYFAYGKLNHVLYGLASIFLRDLGPTGRLSYPDIDALLETDEDALDSLGVANIEQLSWKALLDLDACVNCGRCESVCPAHTSGSPLSPRKLIRDMKAHLDEVGPALLATASGEAGGEDSASERPPLFGDAADGAPTPAVLEAELWGCRTCGACQRECPMFIEHVPKIVDMRRYLVMTESKMGEDAQAFLKNMDDRMHPFVGAAHDREEWFQGLDVKIFANGDSAEYLFWVGCAGAMVDRNIAVSRAMVKVLDAAGVDFALLGAEEMCTGDPARRVGGELTYQVCAKENIETFERYGIEKIIVTCPHCFNTLQNEYPDYGGRYQVTHHSQLIAEMIQSGRLKLAGGLESVTYHDPCYLGRHNEIYDEPRQVIDHLTKVGGFVELDRSRSRSDCCGSGGGYAWMDDKPEKRINHTRFEQVKGCGAKTAALSCPFCMQMFDDAIGALDPDQSVRAVDIAELVAEALENSSDG